MTKEQPRLNESNDDFFIPIYADDELFHENKSQTQPIETN